VSEETNPQTAEEIAAAQAAAAEAAAQVWLNRRLVADKQSDN
jgi:hypothetical protein